MKTACLVCAESHDPRLSCVEARSLEKLLVAIKLALEVGNLRECVTLAIIESRP